MGLPKGLPPNKVYGMARERYKMPDGDVAAEFERVCHLFSLALGRPSDRLLFDSLMGEANDRGMDWVQGLEYVIEQRRRWGTLSAGSSYARRGIMSDREAVGDLRLAG